jgi:polar amino acid transport system permease protein
VVRHQAPVGRRLTRRRRGQLIRAAQYSVLAAAVLALALLANWQRIGEAFFDADVIRELFPEIITVALKNTVLYTLCAFAFGGVPALLVLIGFGYGIPIALNTELPGGTLGTITVALGLVAAAYMAETFRAGIQAVPKGQTEAARSLGMSHGRALVSIVIPQAFRIILPPLTNELILLTKDSSLVYLLGVTLPTRELAKFGRDSLNQYVSMTPILIAGLAYLIITVPLGYVVRRLEAQQAKAR